MISKKIKITNEAGVHARPATSLVNVCMHYDCQILLNALKHSVDFKSIMGVMSLGVYSGTIVEIVCDGSDEEEAMKSILEKIYELQLGKEV